MPSLLRWFFVLFGKYGARATIRRSVNFLNKENCHVICKVKNIPLSSKLERTVLVINGENYADLVRHSD